MADKQERSGKNLRKNRLC